MDTQLKLCSNQESPLITEKKTFKYFKNGKLLVDQFIEDAKMDNGTSKYNVYACSHGSHFKNLKVEYIEDFLKSQIEAIQRGWKGETLGIGFRPDLEDYFKLWGDFDIVVPDQQTEVNWTDYINLFNRFLSEKHNIDQEKIMSMIVLTRENKFDTECNCWKAGCHVYYPDIKIQGKSLEGFRKSLEAWKKENNIGAEIDHSIYAARKDVPLYGSCKPGSHLYLQEYNDLYINLLEYNEDAYELVCEKVVKNANASKNNEKSNSKGKNYKELIDLCYNYGLFDPGNHDVKVNITFGFADYSGCDSKCRDYLMDVFKKVNIGNGRDEDKNIQSYISTFDSFREGGVTAATLYFYLKQCGLSEEDDLVVNEAFKNMDSVTLDVVKIVSSGYINRTYIHELVKKILRDFEKQLSYFKVFEQDTNMIYKWDKTRYRLINQKDINKIFTPILKEIGLKIESYKVKILEMGKQIYVNNLMKYNQKTDSLKKEIQSIEYKISTKKNIPHAELDETTSKRIENEIEDLNECLNKLDAELEAVEKPMDPRKNITKSFVSLINTFGKDTTYYVDLITSEIPRCEFEKTDAVVCNNGIYYDGKFIRAEDIDHTADYALNYLSTGNDYVEVPENIAKNIINYFRSVYDVDEYKDCYNGVPKCDIYAEFEINSLSLHMHRGKNINIKCNYGQGSNGKSWKSHLLRKTFGEYVGTLTLRVLKEKSVNNPVLLNNRDKRIIYMNDVTEEIEPFVFKPFDDESENTATYKYSNDDINFFIRAGIYLNTNNPVKFTTKDMDNSNRRRITYIPHKRTFGNDQDVELGFTFDELMSYIVNLNVRKLSVPEFIYGETSSIINENSTLVQFANTYLIPNERCNSVLKDRPNPKMRDIQNCFNHFCDMNNDKDSKVNQKILWEKLRNVINIRKIRDNSISSHKLLDWFENDIFDYDTGSFKDYTFSPSGGPGHMYFYDGKPLEKIGEYKIVPYNHNKFETIINGCGYNRNLLLIAKDHVLFTVNDYQYNSEPNDRCINLLGFRISGVNCEI